VTPENILVEIQARSQTTVAGRACMHPATSLDGVCMPRACAANIRGRTAYVRWTLHGAFCLPFGVLGAKS